jgi:hypothetical protein
MAKDKLPVLDELNSFVLPKSKVVDEFSSIVISSYINGNKAIELRIEVAEPESINLHFPLLCEDSDRFKFVVRDKRVKSGAMHIRVEYTCHGGPGDSLWRTRERIENELSVVRNKVSDCTVLMANYALIYVNSRIYKKEIDTELEEVMRVAQMELNEWKWVRRSLKADLRATTRLISFWFPFKRTETRVENELANEYMERARTAGSDLNKHFKSLRELMQSMSEVFAAEASGVSGLDEMESRIEQLTKEKNETFFANVKWMVPVMKGTMTIEQVSSEDRQTMKKFEEVSAKVDWLKGEELPRMKNELAHYHSQINKQHKEFKRICNAALAEYIEVLVNTIRLSFERERMAANEQLKVAGSNDQLKSMSVDATTGTVSKSSTNSSSSARKNVIGSVNSKRRNRGAKKSIKETTVNISDATIEFSERPVNEFLAEFGARIQITLSFFFSIAKYKLMKLRVATMKILAHVIEFNQCVAQIKLIVLQANEVEFDLSRLAKTQGDLTITAKYGEKKIKINMEQAIKISESKEVDVVAAKTENFNKIKKIEEMLLSESREIKLKNKAIRLFLENAVGEFYVNARVTGFKNSKEFLNRVLSLNSILRTVYDDLAKQIEENKQCIKSDLAKLNNEMRNVMKDKKMLNEWSERMEKLKITVKKKQQIAQCE